MRDLPPIFNVIKLMVSEIIEIKKDSLKLNLTSENKLHSALHSWKE